MELNVKSLSNSGETKSSVNVSELTFNREYNEPLIHQVVTAYMAAGRAGTKAQKSRSDVSGGGKKPWKQKGTGRARAGSSRSPIWRKGGVVFAARPRDYSQKVNKKMYYAAMCSILSELKRQDRFIVVDDIIIKQPKTSEAIALLGQLAVTDALIITSDVTENLYLATRNIPNIDVRDVQGIDPLSLIQYQNIVITVDALKKLEESLA